MNTKMIMSVDYDHKANLHTVAGPRTALPLILAGNIPNSILDVGCGTGTWLNAFKELKVKDYFGIDGVDIPEAELLFEKKRFEVVNFAKPWTLGRKFDLAICLEVAEHLPPDSSKDLIKALCEHTDRIIFSAACPSQPGQNHINCHWPGFWQELFNKNGFACEDDLRPKIWNVAGIEVWYRQNIFTAHRSLKAGSEDRIRGMVHPDFISLFLDAAASESAKAASFRTRKEIIDGSLHFSDYPGMTARAFWGKFKRRLGK